MRRIIQITVLIISGEIVFSLPFHTARFFRPTLLDVFGFSNTDLGDIFAVFGITAMLAYFPGGVIADRYSARALLSFSLILTALGGLYMATIPGPAQMALLYGYWGVTTSLFFWSALIKATREWGGEMSQGKAFGIMDGGRGFIAAAIAVLAVGLLASYMPADIELTSDAERRSGFSAVVMLYVVVTATSGLLTWVFLPVPKKGAVSGDSRLLFNGAVDVLRQPLVWAQAGVIVCAYCGYKGGDNISLYAVQVLGMNEIDGASLSAYATYIRPVAAVVAGFLADRFIASRVLATTFSILVVSYFLLFIATPTAVWLTVIYANIFISFFAVFALRGIYFALIQETRTPTHLTGTTVGVVSFLGFTPEIFFAPITGRILDASPGVAGHQNYFLFLAGVSLIGFVVTLWLVLANKRALAGAPGLTWSLLMGYKQITVMIVLLLTWSGVGAQDFTWPDESPDEWLLAFVDVETTGLTPGYHEMIDIGIVMTDLHGRELGDFFVRIRPEHPERTQEGARAVNAFDERRWKELAALTSTEAVEKISEFHHALAGDRSVLIVAFNSHFDAAFLDHLFRGGGGNWRDLYHYFILDLPSMAWSRGMHGLTGQSLSEALDVEDEPHVADLHTGITGAKLNARIYRALMSLPAIKIRGEPQ